MYNSVQQTLTGVDGDGDGCRLAINMPSAVIVAHGTAFDGGFHLGQGSFTDAKGTIE